jgi:hypothetical protein
MDLANKINMTDEEIYDLLPENTNFNLNEILGDKLEYFYYVENKVYKSQLRYTIDSEEILSRMAKKGMIIRCHPYSFIDNIFKDGVFMGRDLVYTFLTNIKNNSYKNNIKSNDNF